MQLRPFWKTGLTPEMLAVAEIELGETQDNRQRAIKELNCLIEEEMGFCPLKDEEFLVRFLRAKKFDVKRAHKTLKSYYSFKSQYSGRITDLIPENLRSVLDRDKVFIAPKRGHGGEGVIMAFIGDLDGGDEDCPVDEHLAACVLAAEIGIETDASQVCGSSILIDFRGVTAKKLASYCNLSFLSILIRGLQGCWPYRINGVHIVNEPSYFTHTYSLIRPLLSKKLRERVHLHGYDLDSLKEFFPAEILPEHLGGHVGPKDFEEFRSHLFRQTPLIQRINSYTFQNKRYPKSCNNRNVENLNEAQTTRKLFESCIS